MVTYIFLTQQKSMMELFMKIVKAFKSLTVFAIKFHYRCLIGSVIKRQTSQATSDYERLRVRLRVITRDYESTSDYKSDCD